jgi:AcrR family transcriptional regulator
MPKAAPKTENAKIAAAALRLAATKGWAGVTCDSLAKEAKLSPSALKKRFAAPHEFVPIIVGEVTREALSLAGNPRGAPHDVLFELLMARFDVLQKNRKGILAMAEAGRRDSKLFCTFLRAVLKGIESTADAAKLSSPPRPILIAGLSAVSAAAFLAWRRDETRDMSKTMAALDRALKLAGSTVVFFKQSF